VIHMNPVVPREKRVWGGGTQRRTNSSLRASPEVWPDRKGEHTPERVAGRHITLKPSSGELLGEGVCLIRAAASSVATASARETQPGKKNVSKFGKGEGGNRGMSGDHQGSKNAGSHRKGGGGEAASAGGI